LEYFPHHFHARSSAQPTMSLALSDVKRIAHLAQLELNDDQAAKSLQQLNGIFALVEQMREDEAQARKLLALT